MARQAAKVASILLDAILPATGTVIKTSCIRVPCKLLILRENSAIGIEWMRHSVQGAPWGSFWYVFNCSYIIVGSSWWNPTPQVAYRAPGTYKNDATNRDVLKKNTLKQPQVICVVCVSYILWNISIYIYLSFIFIILHLFWWLGSTVKHPFFSSVATSSLLSYLLHDTPAAIFAVHLTTALIPGCCRGPPWLQFMKFRWNHIYTTNEHQQKHKHQTLMKSGQISWISDQIKKMVNKPPTKTGQVCFNTSYGESSPLIFFTDSRQPQRKHRRLYLSLGSGWTLSNLLTNFPTNINVTSPMFRHVLMMQLVSMTGKNTPGKPDRMPWPCPTFGI